MEQHVFSLEEANALIPKLELIMGRLQQRVAELRRGIDELAQQTGKVAGDLTSSEIIELRPTLRPAIVEVEQLLGEIEECGGEFKGLDLGLVDFPTEINGEPAVWCWQFGEKEIGYWHSLHEGFAGRQPLSERRARATYLQ